jgi:hypothetical protein
MSEYIPLPSEDLTQALYENLSRWVYEITGALYIHLGVEPYICEENLFRYAYLRDVQIIITLAINRYIHDFFDEEESDDEDEPDDIYSAREVAIHTLWNEISIEATELEFEALYDGVDSSADDDIQEGAEILQPRILRSIKEDEFEKNSFDEYDVTADKNPGCRIVEDEVVRDIGEFVFDDFTNFFNDKVKLRSDEEEILESAVMYIYLFLCGRVGEKKVDVLAREYFEYIAVSKIDRDDGLWAA